MTERYLRFLTWGKETLAKLAEELTEEVMSLRDANQELESIAENSAFVQILQVIDCHRCGHQMLSLHPHDVERVECSKCGAMAQCPPMDKQQRRTVKRWEDSKEQQ
jgi:hypothetical protein